MPPDEEIRVSGRRGTTPVPPASSKFVEGLLTRRRPLNSPPARYAGGTEIRRLRPAPITSAEPTPHEGLFYIEKNLRNKFSFVAGREVIVDAELVGIRKNLQLVLPAEVQ